MHIIFFDLTKRVYIDEYLEIEKANFRLTDKNMLKTKYYQSKVFKNFRKEFLDCLSNKNPESIYLNMKYLSPKQINYLKESLKTNK